MGYSFSRGDRDAPGEFFYYNPNETQETSTFYARFNEEDKTGVLVSVSGTSKLIKYGNSPKGETERLAPLAF
ncbi:hypothetical protein AURDEDRAFT_117341 [Auricularia subglabra TFB-10046 SS5]|nr:hypothetical protein AURDEDRAFT_117341 [Auricularia subglabra TFB-10046 SS5]